MNVYICCRWIDRVRCIFCSLDPASNESLEAGLYRLGPIVCDRLILGHCGLGIQHYSTLLAGVG